MHVRLLAVGDLAGGREPDPDAVAVLPLSDLLRDPTAPDT